MLKGLSTVLGRLRSTALKNQEADGRCCLRRLSQALAPVSSHGSCLSPIALLGDLKGCAEGLGRGSGAPDQPQLIKCELLHMLTKAAPTAAVQGRLGTGTCVGLNYNGADRAESCLCRKPKRWGPGLAHQTALVLTTFLVLLGCQGQRHS